MSFSELVGQTFDHLTPLLLDLVDSQYLNVGYWDKNQMSFVQAQQRLVDLFGRFSKLKKGVEVIDVGFGTGEQDLYFVDHFHCKRILGINPSKFQVEMALKKIRNKKKYTSVIEFQQGDAIDLADRPTKSCNRILALECDHLFEDKNKFFRGAYRILRPKGYLCLASAIPNRNNIYNENIVAEIQREISGESEWKDIDLSKLQEKMTLTLEKQKNSKNLNIQYNQTLDLLQKNGFLIEESKDISTQVLGFFPKIKQRTSLLIKEPFLDHTQNEILLSLLASWLILHYTIKNKLVGFFLIRAKKL
jgi:cyclopropane fatty-acyl-phospholipid synthase-like methyltransferase